jgi:nucleoside-diphosphate-sugar epimerase
MRFLVTGANGFVGAAMCAELAARGHAVRGAARASVACDDVFINTSIDGSTLWADALANIDVVMHLAARVHVMQEDVADPLSEFLQTNLEGTLNLARQAQQAGVRRFVYVSSIKVLGESTPKGGRFSELSEPMPQDPYAISKFQAEQALHEFAQETGLEVVIVRPPLVYGPGVRANFAQLLSVVNRGLPLPFKGIKNSRSLIFVGNLVDALILCAIHSAAAGQTYLVDDGMPLSSSELIAVMAKASGVPNRDFKLPVSLLRIVAAILRRPGFVERLTQSLVVDSHKIRSELGWMPPFEVAEGISRTTRWFQDRAIDTP